jgi:hypothetical protein
VVDSESYPPSPLAQAGLAVIESVRRLILASDVSAGQIPDLSGVLEPVADFPPPTALYQAIALCSGMVGFLSQETGRSWETILEELAKNYRS